MKKLGKVFSFALIFVLTAAMLLSATALAAGKWTELSAEQYVAVMPYLDVYLYPTDKDGNTVYGMDLSNTEITAVLDQEILAIDGFAGAKEFGTAYIFVLDIEQEADNYHVVEALKRGLQTFVSRLGQNDRMVLITYGDDVYKVLDGDEDAAEASKRIAGIRQTTEGSLFYEAMNQALEIAASDHELPDRKLIIPIESGASLSESDVQRDQLIQAVIDSGFPIYAISTGTQESSKKSMLLLTDAVGGKTYYVSYLDAEATLDDLHTYFDSCYVLSLRTATNFVEPVNRRLNLDMSNGSVKKSLSMQLRINYWISDTSAPAVLAATAMGDSALAVQFSENVTGADSAASFTLTHSGMGKQFRISGAEYDPKSAVAVLKLEEKLVRGEYSLAVSGVCDFSMEANPIVCGEDEPFCFTLEDESLAKPSFYVDFASFGLTAWLVIGLILLLVAGAVIFIIVYSKRRKEEKNRLEEEKKWRDEQERRQQEEIDRRKKEEQERRQQSGMNGQRFVADRINSLPVTITVVQENGIKRSIDAVVGEKFVIGRDAGSCELAIEDRLLSRQHLRLSFRNGCLLVADLGSTNKTYLNGVVIGAERQLQPNDVILAGKSRIFVSVKF